MAILERGYAIAGRADDGSILTDSGQVSQGDKVSIRLAHGRVLSEVVGTEPAIPPVGS